MSVRVGDQLIIVETPFQLLVALCVYEANRDDFCASNVDIAVYAQFEGAADYAKAMRGTGLFRNVYLIPPFYGRVTREGSTHLFEMLFRKKRNERRFFENCPELHGKNYDRIYAAGATRFPLDAKQYCAQSADTMLYEDGTGSRNGAIFKALAFLDPVTMVGVPFSFEERVKLIGKKMVNAVTGGKFRLQTNGLWLFSPDPTFAEKFPDISVICIPKTYAQGDLVKSVMTPVIGGKRIPQIIYFAVPPQTAGGVKEVQEGLIECLAQKKDWDLKVKRHPRAFDMALPESLESGFDDISWEALCGMLELRDDNVLMGFGSTAQTTPKMLYGVEPYQIFLHKLLPSNSSLRIAAQGAMEELCRAYKSNNRVFAPESFDEIQEIVERVSKAEN